MTAKEIQKILLTYCRYIINFNGIPITGIQTKYTTELAEELFTTLIKSNIKEEYVKEQIILGQIEVLEKVLNQKNFDGVMNGIRYEIEELKTKLK